MSSNWTINSTLAVMATENGDTDWDRKPLSNTLKSGTRSTRVIFGNEPYVRANPLFTTVEAAYTALRDAYRNSTTITLTDEYGTFTDVRVIAFAMRKHPAGTAWIGSVTFERD